MEMIKETAKVVRQQQIDEGIFDMELSFPKGAALAKPGQFIAMYCNDKSKLLPRPISICGINPTEGTLRVVYRVAGEGTKEFSEMKAGDTLEVMGPLGNGFTMKNEKAIIIGGGIGIPPMLELAKQKGEDPFLILLDNIEDPHNLGAIIRTANLAGAHGVIIPKHRAAGLTATVAKTSAGALNYTTGSKSHQSGENHGRTERKGTLVRLCRYGWGCDVPRESERTDWPGDRKRRRRCWTSGKRNL